MAPPTVREMEGRLCLSVFATILSNLSVIIIIFTSAQKYKAEHIPLQSPSQYNGVSNYLGYVNLDLQIKRGSWSSDWVTCRSSPSPISG